MICRAVGQSIRKVMYPEHSTPLPISIILIVFVVAFTSSWMYTMVSSFIPKLVFWFGVKSVDIGFKVGLVDSSIYIGAFVSSLLWGYLSDKKGKRFCILATSICCVVTALGFGFSQGLWWAVAMKFLQGCSLGQVVVLKGLLKEVCDDSNIAVGMSVLLTAPAMGSIIGPSVGGYTAFPHQLYPKVFTEGSLFAQFPALLPNLIIVAGLGVGIALAVLFLPKDGRQNFSSCEEGNNLLHWEVAIYGSFDSNDDSYKNKNSHCIGRRDSPKTNTGNNNTDNKDENRNENKDKKYNCKNHNSINVNKDSNYVQQKNERIISINENNNYNGDSEDNNTEMNRQINNEICNNTYSNKISGCSRFFHSVKQSGILKVLQTRECLLCCLLLILFASSEIGFGEMLPVLASTDPKYKGMGFEPSDIGLLLTIVSMVQIVFQLTLLPKLSTYFGPQKFLIMSNIIQAIFCPLVPAFALLHNRTLMWVALVVVIFVVNTSIFTGYLSLDILVNNSVSVDIIGSALGVTMTASYLGRLVAPIMFGGIYSWSLKNIKGIPGNVSALGFPFDQFLTFFVMSLLSVTCALVTSRLPTHMNQVSSE